MSVSSINWVLVGQSLRGVVHRWILSRRSLGDHPRLLVRDPLRVVLMSELSHRGLTLVPHSLRPDSLSRVSFPRHQRYLLPESSLSALPARVTLTLPAKSRVHSTSELVPSLNVASHQILPLVQLSPSRRLSSGSGLALSPMWRNMVHPAAMLDVISDLTLIYDVIAAWQVLTSASGVDPLREVESVLVRSVFRRRVVHI